MRTKQQYIEGLRKMRRNIYHDGHKIDRDDEVQMPTINTIGLTFDYANDPKHADLCTAKSHLTGETINRFTHIHHSKEDLHKKQDMTRLLCQVAGGCIQRCMGIDGANAIYNISYEADKQNNGATQYHENFKKWVARFQKEDLVGCCAQTDVKGDRMKRPSEQVDPDLYVHVVERKKDGIVVRGSKVHNSEASVADEILVVPTRALLPNEKDWAVAFAVPGDWEGVKQVVTIHNLRDRQYFKRGFTPGATDSYTIFDNCFIPWERVFLCGETIHGGVCALLFALFHRHSYSGCKPALGDLMLGTVALAAEYNGIAKASHVRDKLAEIIRVSELGYAAGFTASEMGKPEVYIPGRGVQALRPGKLYSPFHLCECGPLPDRGGGVPGSGDSLRRLRGHPGHLPLRRGFHEPGDQGPSLNKYITRNPEIPPEDAAQLWRYVGDLACSATGGIHNYGRLPRRRLADHGIHRHHHPV